MRRIVNTAVLVLFGVIYLCSSTGLQIRSQRMPPGGSGEHAYAAAGSQKAHTSHAWAQRRHLTIRIAPVLPDWHAVPVVSPGPTVERPCAALLPPSANVYLSFPTSILANRAPPPA